MNRLFIGLLMCSIYINAEVTTVVDDVLLSKDNNTSRKNDDVKFAVEVGTKTDFWNPGLSGNVLNYDTEGLFLGFGKFKVKLYDTDVFTFEKYQTLNSSDNQNDLLASYKSDQKKSSTIDGMRISLDLIKVVNFLFDKEWLEGLNYEFNTKNFIGSASILQNSAYWYGNTVNGEVGKDFTVLVKGNELSFKTKFTSHKLSYKFDDIFNQVKGSFVSIGAFDQEWSKPTFVADTAFNGALPVIFDSNYYSKGVSSSIGVLTNSYNVKAFIDYGIDNEMKIIEKKGSYSDYNKDVNIYMMGLNANYTFEDIYSNNSFNTDFIIGLEMQYSSIVQDGNNELDAETLYGINAAVEVTF